MNNVPSYSTVGDLRRKLRLAIAMKQFLARLRHTIAMKRFLATLQTRVAEILRKITGVDGQNVYDSVRNLVHNGALFQSLLEKLGDYGKEIFIQVATIFFVSHEDVEKLVYTLHNATRHKVRMPLTVTVAPDATDEEVMEAIAGARAVMDMAYKEACSHIAMLEQELEVAMDNHTLEAKIGDVNPSSASSAFKAILDYMEMDYPDEVEFFRLCRAAVTVAEADRMP